MNGVNVIQSPQNKGSQRYRLGGFPGPIHNIYKVVHERLYAEMCGRLVVSYGHGTGTKFTRICVQASYGLEVERLDDV